MDLPRLHGGEALQVRRSEEEANGQQERVPQRAPIFISPDGFGLGCTGDGCDWAPWAALWDGIMH
jgi:hypothetical protein